MHSKMLQIVHLHYHSSLMIVVEFGWKICELWPCVYDCFFNWDCSSLVVVQICVVPHPLCFAAVASCMQPLWVVHLYHWPCPLPYRITLNTTTKVTIEVISSFDGDCLHVASFPGSPFNFEVQQLYSYTGRSPVMYNLAAGNYHFQVVPQGCGRERDKLSVKFDIQEWTPPLFWRVIIKLELIAIILGTREYCCCFEL